MGCLGCIAGIHHGTAALGRQIVLVPAVTDEAADVLFAQPVIVGGIDKVDTSVERGVEDAFRLLVRDWPTAPDTLPPNLHCAVAQLGDFQAGASQNPSFHENPSFHDRCSSFRPPTPGDGGAAHVLSPGKSAPD